MSCGASEASPIGALVRIDDPGDPRIADYRHLKDATLRAAHEGREAIFVAEGRLAVRHLLGSSYPVRSLLVDDYQVQGAAEIVAGVQALGAPVYVATREILADTVGFAFHRGVVAVAHRGPRLAGSSLVEMALAGSDPPARQLFAVLEGLNDHENLGALFRNAAAFGVAGVLLDPTCADPLYRRSVRVSLGHVLTCPFGTLAPWPDALGALRARGVQIVALTPRRVANHERPIELADLAARWTGRPVALLLGAEGGGLSPDALAAADQLATITMADGVDSLNVATAAAIAFHALAPDIGRAASGSGV